MIEAKILFGLLIAIFFISIIRQDLSNQFRVREKLFLLLLFFSSCLILVNPQFLDKLAILIKVERGRDLLFYIYMIIATWGAIRNHIRLNMLSNRINKITSHLAIIASRNDYNKKK